MHSIKNRRNKPLYKKFLPLRKDIQSRDKLLSPQGFIWCCCCCCSVQLFGGSSSNASKKRESSFWLATIASTDFDRRSKKEKRVTSPRHSPPYNWDGSRCLSRMLFWRQLDSAQVLTSTQCRG